MPGPHLTASEQLVDVPVPQIPERPSRRELHEVLSRLTRNMEEEEVVAEDEEEEEEEGSRFLPHFRPRRWCRATCLRGWQCTFAHHECGTLGRAGGGMVVDVPVVQIVDVGIQFLDTVIDMPAFVHVVFVVLKLWKFRSCST